MIETNFHIREAQKDKRGYRVIAGSMDGPREFTGEALLMATGRRPNTSDIGSEEAGVNLSKNGEILVNDYLQTSNPNVYAVGDITSCDMYVYVVGYSGKLAAENAINGNSLCYDTDVLPRVTFTDPAVASVGLTEEQAYDEGHEVKVTALPMEFVARAKSIRDSRGLIKPVADKSTDRLIGAHVLSTDAGEVIQVATTAMKACLTIEELQDTFLPYLTMAEGLKLAAQSFDKNPALLSCCAGSHSDLLIELSSKIDSAKYGDDKMTTLETILTEQLERLFVAELQYTSEEEPIVSAEGRDGVLIGNGDGTVTGEKVHGTIRWSFYSGNCAYVFVRAGIEPPPGQHLCTTYPGGVIETDDGAQIWFDAKGFGLRGYDETQPHLWRLTMGVHFSTDAERYAWLNTAPGLLVSDFDERANRGIWRVYLPWGSG